MVRTLVVDTKPRFIAQYELNGLTTKASGRYKKWGMGSSIFENSYVLSGQENIKTELDRVWGLKSNVAIVQKNRWEDLDRISETVRRFYEGYGAKIPRLVYVDELADFYTRRALGDIFMDIARTGRERGVALIACSQRPRKIPTEVITELKRLYMFHLSYREDIKHIWEFGIPKEVIPPTPDSHAFYMYDKTLREKFPSNAYHVLELKK